MKKVLLFAGFLLSVQLNGRGQSYEVQQLLLDWTKLMQMKQILVDMKTGYQILEKGYSAVRDISRGTFRLHEAFLDGLWLVSPAVRDYWKIPVIIQNASSLVREYKSAFIWSRQSGCFDPDEIQYLEKVYRHLFDQSLKDLDELALVLTAGKLRMHDAERLDAIDRIYHNMQNKLTFLRQFNDQTAVLALQRKKEQNSLKTVRLFFTPYHR